MEERNFNKLVNEKSLYLRQHSTNPVNWYPWSEEAFELAKQKNRPVFLSIGYSSCHWCHVMEKESFENEEIARILNDNFISIKVDREELPDVDNFYMTFVQASTGSGGWPLNVFLLPDKTPFFGGTYFPPEPKFGKPSFKTVLNSVLETYKNKSDELEKLKAEITNFFEKSFIDANYSDEINYAKLKDAHQVIVNNYDWKNGGWGKSSKFPMFPLLNFLIDYYLVFKDENSKKIVEHNLFKILTGGIYDHIGGGMHRYTVDNQWIIPHFEKMLYDNAQLIQTIAKYLIIDENNFFKNRLNETFHFMKNELKLENGGYLTAIDADSEGEEGKFYLWNYYELVDTVEEKFDKELFFEYYQFNLIEKDKFLGNISMRKIPDQNDSILLNELSLVQLHLEQNRKKKIPPEKDNKVLTDLNSLLISALTLTFRATEDQKFINEAISIFDFIQKNLLKQNKLFHSYAEGETKIEGFADDYFNFIQALVDLYEVTFDEKYLYQAYEILNNSISLFYDRDKKVIYQQTEDSRLPIRTTENNDYSKPSSTALATALLLKLGKLFEEKTFISIAEELLHKNFNDAVQNPFGRGKFLSTLLHMVSPDAQLILVEGDDNTSFDKFKSFLFRKISPVQLTLFRKKDSSFNFSYLQDKKPFENKLTLYVCENFTCQRPLNNPDQLNF